MICCRNCKHCYWVTSSTGRCETSYCDLTKKPTKFHFDFEQLGPAGGDLKCGDYKRKKED